MTTLHIEHAITDFATWRTAFEGFADLRRDAGVRAHRVQRPVDDPCYVLVDLDFDDEAAATAFHELLRVVVWAVPENAPALAGEPRALVVRTDLVG